jgi:hypothetical protein
MYGTPPTVPTDRLRTGDIPARDERINDSTPGKPRERAHSGHEEMVAMRSGGFLRRRGRRWLRRHVRVVAVPRRRSEVVTARTSVPEISISVRRRPDPSRATIEAVQQ